MNTLILKNVRCFVAPGPIPLAPLTLLVGENSTGKSSLLALTRIAWDIAYRPNSIDFNEDPFLLGAYEQIANYRGGPKGRARSFEIGFETKPKEQKNSTKNESLPHKTKYKATFQHRGTQPSISEMLMEFPPYVFRIEFSPEKIYITLSKDEQNKTVIIDRQNDSATLFLGRNVLYEWGYFLYLLAEKLNLHHPERRKQEEFPTYKDISSLQDNFMPFRMRGINRPFASAPVRTKPQRTYDPRSEQSKAEGHHVPMILAKSYFEEMDTWKSLKSSLDRFGNASGLFRSIDIKPLDKRSSGPFQISIKISGTASNLIDVGYGVSQILPILVDTILGAEEQIYLLQQPEVHLHPRGQAELGTFFGQMVAQHKKQFIIETHSDYMIDRVRMDVRDKKNIKPNDVIILYFERVAAEVRIHPVRIDDSGNLIDVPPSYRRFFLNEEHRLLIG